MPEEIELPAKTKKQTKDADLWQDDDELIVGNSSSDIDIDIDIDSEGNPLLHTTIDGFGSQHMEGGVVTVPLNDSSLQQQQRQQQQQQHQSSSEANRHTTAFGKFCWLWHKHWMGPDDSKGWTIRCNERVVTLLDASGVRLLKFVVVTAACLVVVHGYAFLAGDKRDTTYDLQKMLVYDGKSIATDAIVFFVVGRLYNNNNNNNFIIDTLAFVIPLLATALLQSWGATHLQSLQHSITPYDLKCEWSWQMYLLVMGGCLPLLGALVVTHCKEVIARGTGLRALVEFASTGILFLLPYYGTISSEERMFFHLHHWYYAWFLGMHCNLHGKWWSELAMSVLWGIYINGVAIFGRDPVLTCSVSLYQSQSQECAYLAPETEYGLYTLEDLARDSGILVLSSSGDEVLPGDSGETIAKSTMVCASDVTRWLFGGE